MTLSEKISNRNFRSFLWHAGFLAMAQNFMDVDTIIPAMLVEAGGGAIHIGIMTAIMLGGAQFTQLFFAPWLSNKTYKKNYLLFGINTRVFALAGLGALLFFLQSQTSGFMLVLMFLFITLFSFTGAFANISYFDILGKSINVEKRKLFFSTRQIISGIIVLGAAFLARKVLVMRDFPINYSFMFFIGATLLLTASIGFWNLKETVPSTLKISGIKGFLKVLKKEVRENKQLIWFLGFINTQGIAVSFLPFVVLYAKETFAAESTDTGTFLLFKVIGIVFVSALVLMGAKKLKYNLLLYSNVAFSLVLGLMPFFITDISWLKYIFVMGGLVYALYTMTMNGLLLEISGNENRALYTGFAGAGNILPALFPLVAGTIIELFGFSTFFVLFIVVVSLAAFFIFKINCKR
ncbi:MAG: MFS transporter [Tangfeifania sp.]